MTTYAPEPDDLGDAPATYEVRLMTHIEAEAPAEAAAGFIDLLMRRGLMAFAYRVRDIATGQAWYVQDGTVVTVEEFVAAMRANDDDTDN